MPFLRFSRDKRGYEHTYLVHTANRRGKPSRPRILYWYRTPPGVRVGRKPFDEEVRRTIEAQNPGVVFDWDSFAKAQIPAAEPEPWWERRRAERAAKQARRADDEGETAEPSSSAMDTPGGDRATDEAEELAEAVPPPQTSEENGSVLPAAIANRGEDIGTTRAAGAEPADGGDHSSSGRPTGGGQLADGQAAGQSAGRKRRRRGGRRRRGRSGPPGAAAPVANSDAIPDTEDASEPGDFDPSSPEE